MSDIKMTQNLHTHTTMCDGRDTPERMVERAIALGFDSIGFSGHANTVFREACELGDRLYPYIDEINRLKGAYAEKIKIFLGTELDYYSAGCMPEGVFDYSIASVHYTVREGELVSYDLSVEHSKDAIARLFGGSGLEYARAYFETMADMPRRLSADFVGHFDILTKYEAKAPELFDTGCHQYRKMALEALTAVREKYEFFEVNTGPIGRGYKPAPYPQPFILDEMKARKCKLLITSDCHNSKFLDCGFGEAVELLRAHGFDEIYKLTDRGFVGMKI